ncbi:GerMN domain-containing protein [Pseudobacillus badius]|uniref:GerMN domain-containing protein n=1 Tax=Bacillus badius TaxID=1455 RepID=UPI0007B03E5A|nr:GerMN domain-containing protein [Bacillus badius]KZN98652.1 sporulation protein [Bacillus badius]OCS83593.1 sporulation protein [Bacillus badius]OVE53122.1 sporulation protein [Bacillus badius]TDW05171.1 germination protein M [Bacillus badius]UAT29737.1 GerMN domain-containing protein [Bacillus badius]
MRKKKTAAAAVILISSVYTAGCGLWPEEKKEKIDPPQSVVYTDNLSGEEGQKTAQNKDMVMTELYLIDKNGYVVSQTMPLPNTKSLAKQAVEYLVAEGPVSNLIPNGFRAVLPAGTQVKSVDIKKGTATVDFSPEFKEYEKADEGRIVQALTWTLTQFDSVKRVKMQVNGQTLSEMPVGKMALAEDGTTRQAGINVDASGVVDLADTRAVTVYYMAQEGEGYYYVPVTKRVSNEEQDQITAIVKELAKGPRAGSGLVTEFLPEAELLEKPVMKEGRVTLNFNEAILGSFENKMVSEHILKSLALSLTEGTEVESLAIQVGGNSNITTEQGKPLSSSVTRPDVVNPVDL